MNSKEILKLMRECGAADHGYPPPHWAEAFYRAAYNKAIEDAAKKCEVWDVQTVAKKIRALEMK